MPVFLTEPIANLHRPVLNIIPHLEANTANDGIFNKPDMMREERKGSL
jgi:hypothetical protein